MDANFRLGPLDGLVAVLGRGRGAVGNAGNALGAVGDLPGGGHQFLDGRGDLRHRGDLFLGAGGLLVGGGLKLARRTLNVLDGRTDLPAKRAGQEERQEARNGHAGDGEDDHDDDGCRGDIGGMRLGGFQIRFLQLDEIRQMPPQYSKSGTTCSWNALPTTARSSSVWRILRSLSPASNWAVCILLELLQGCQLLGRALPVADLRPIGS